MLILAGCTSVSDGPVAETETASVAPSPTPKLTTQVELGDGHLTFEVPESWETELEDFTATFEADPSAPQFNGRSAQRAHITNPDGTVSVDVFTNIPWPDVVAVDLYEVELLHAEPLDMGYEPSDDGHGMWLRAVIGEPPGAAPQQPTHGLYDEGSLDEEYVLVVAPYFAKADLGPPDELGAGQTAFRFPYSEDTAGAWWDENITVAAGIISQNAAEELTCASGVDAMRQVVDTEEYAELVDVIQSFQVHVETSDSAEQSL